MERRERLDAARNRHALLAAARRLFAEQGPDVAFGAIAEAAGVSRTTLYRNFASREDLAATVLEDNVAWIETRARALDGQPGAALTLLNEVFDLQARNRSVSRVLAGEDTLLVDLGRRTSAAFAPLVEQSQAVGLLHPDVHADDFLLALQMAEAGVADPKTFNRARVLLLRGLSMPLPAIT